MALDAIGGSSVVRLVWHFSVSLPLILPALAKIGPAEQIRAIVVDQVYGIALRAMPVSDGADLRPLRVEFSHSPVAPPARYRQHLGCEVRFDQEFDGLMRKLITFMMEDPRTISGSIDTLWVAKAIERIGDHCTNMAEVIHFLETGEDISGVRPKGETDSYNSKA